MSHDKKGKGTLSRTTTDLWNRVRQSSSESSVGGTVKGGSSSKKNGWHQGPDRKLPQTEYNELTRSSVFIYTAPECYDLYWRKTSDGGVQAVVARSVPTAEYQHAEGQFLSQAMFSKGDLGNKTSWAALKNVERYSESVDWQTAMDRRGSVQDKEAGEMPELNTYGFS
ncbi:uncharacterized protein FOMMEDRAFT_28915 [Fomitiporia mediterranea MF3/22]|uniref:uncharacterized protein n=1 Tax=Fomitiporia mediterranea (strain MF3/22) TaxID=694068 RepID=UPI00044082E3|nr:uncharacterized protein FOMMEDRAFT_28915 [Fomitiporia mediterranea MF3/22]EJD03432.1 hypothetical protein FOMMEDRAFT_28915 [Fomitiporia mediterranea MF3/22]